MMRRAADARKKQKEEGAPTPSKPRTLKDYSIETLKVKLLNREITYAKYRHELDKRRVPHA